MKLKRKKKLPDGHARVEVGPFKPTPMKPSAKMPLDALSSLFIDTESRLTTRLDEINATVKALDNRLSIGTGNRKGVWMDRDYVAALEARINLTKAQPQGESPLAHSVELSKRLDVLARELDRRMCRFEHNVTKRLEDMECDLRATAEGNITNHNRMNRIERKQSEWGREIKRRQPKNERQLREAVRRTK